MCSETGIELEELDETYDDFVDRLVDSWFREPDTFSIQVETKREEDEHRRVRSIHT